MKRPTRERLNELLRVDVATGSIFWIRSAGRVRAGALAGCIDKNGYRRLSVDGAEIYAHQIVFFIECGYWCAQIDHINGDRADNRIENLRDVSAAENAKNRAAWRHGVKMGTRKTPEGRWAAGIRCDGSFYHLGVFDTQDEAHAAYICARAGSDTVAAVARRKFLSKFEIHANRLAA